MQLLRQPRISVLTIAAAFTFGVLCASTVDAAHAVPIAASTASSALPDIATIVANLAPTVVSISVSGTRTVSTADDEDEGDSQPQDADPMRDFVRQFQQKFGGLPPKMRLPVKAAGSGIIVRSDGVIMTNAHVIADAEVITVRLADRREFRGRLLGVDPLIDIAIVKIEATDLPVAPITESPETMRVGDWVVAIGAPFGFTGSVTAGVISAVRRSLPGPPSTQFIQTDAVVNPGSSGGPLIDMHGAIVGINAQIYSNTGNYEGLSFAIPIEFAQRSVQQILSRGKVRHAKLGVALQDVDQTLAESFELARPAGALIDDVESDGAAARAGVQTGDIVLAANGRAIDDSGQLAAMMSLAQPGDAVNLDIWHRGAQRTVHFRLDDATPDERGTTDREPVVFNGNLGLALRAPRADERRRSGVTSGLVIAGVSPQAAQAGLQPGDLLLGIDSAAVSTVADLTVAADPNHKPVALLVQRGGRKVYVPLRW